MNYYGWLLMWRDLISRIFSFVLVGVEEHIENEQEKINNLLKAAKNI
jgi:hypothetical protein